MNPDQLTDLIRYTLFTALQISGPLLLIAMVVGFGISIFQSVTQINEMTLTFVPKILIFSGALSLFFPYILKTVMHFAINVLVHQWDKILQLSNNAQ